ncbi:MAG: glycohydrolase toxin TNT-related protein [Actinomycetota bacterium]
MVFADQASRRHVGLRHQRFVAPGRAEARPAVAYTVIRPIGVQAGPAAPAFGQWGGGMQ